MENSLNTLSTRTGFNTSLKHFKTTNSILAQFQKKNNLADILNEPANNLTLKPPLKQVQFITQPLVTTNTYIYHSVSIGNNYIPYTKYYSPFLCILNKRTISLW